jgi:hypothetical protein
MFCLPDDKTVLEKLFKATSGPQWTRRDNWCSALPIEEWYGITAEDGWVTKIDLRNNNLRGPLPESIGELHQLEYLHVQYNSINGKIPGSIASKIGGLQQICAQHNGIEGQVPETLALNADLKLLLLNENQLTGACLFSFMRERRLPARASLHLPLRTPVHSISVPPPSPINHLCSTPKSHQPPARHAPAIHPH